MPDRVEPRWDVEEKQVRDNLDSIHQGRERLLSIIDRANHVAGETDLFDVIRGMTYLMMEVTQADSSNFFELDPVTDELVVKCVQGNIESEHLVGLRINRHLGLPGLSINGKQPVVIGDLPSDQQWLRAIDPQNAARQRNVINLPIVYKDTILGIIQLFNYQHVDLDLLVILGNFLAAEIHKRRELDSSRKSIQRLSTLIDVLGEFAGTLDHNRLLHLVTENASRLVDAERTSVFLVDPQTNEMILQVAYQSPVEEKSQAESNQNSNNTNRFNPATFPLQNRSAHTLTSFNQNGDFSYYNRSAITVPIRSEPLIKNHAVDHKHILGGLMALNRPHASFGAEDAQLMQILANQTSTFLQVAEMYESAGELFLGIIKALAAAIDAKDPYTQGHSNRVSEYSVLISKELGLDESTIYDIRIGSLLHDIGKIGIPDSILMKAGDLTPEEYAIMQKHPEKGENILRKVNLLEPVLPAIAEHHERLDGSGYPFKMTGRDISQLGRIVAVADVFDAMASRRPYRPALSVPEVLSYLQKNSDKLFDADCIQALINILTQSTGVGSGH